MSDDGLLAFCETEYPRLVGMLGLYCGNRAVGEELAQETLARVWRKWPKVHHLDRPESWAHRVAINLANSHFRRLAAERRANRFIDPRAGIVEPPPTEEVLAVREAVARLPRRQRAAVVLHYFLDLPLAEVAETIGTTTPGVKSLLHRALVTLRSEGQGTGLLEVRDVV
jgi:RNA polymerase sigma factor (sigma-70 family)